MILMNKFENVSATNIEVGKSLHFYSEKLDKKNGFSIF